MANKRIQKKRETEHRKKLLQKHIVDTYGYNENRLKNKSLKSLSSIAEKEQQKQEKQRKENRKKYRKELKNRKISLLEKLGYNKFDFSNAEIDKIKIKYLEKAVKDNNKDYQYYSRVASFDFDKIYTLKNGEVVQFAFRDFAGETSLESIISEYDGLSPKRLLDRIHELNSKRPTYSKGAKKKGGGNSSGAAGDYKFLCGQKSAAVANRQDTNAENTRLRRHPKRKSHGAQTYNGYQFLKSNGHHTYTNEITPRNLLIVTCAIMANVTEWDRVNFYNRVYNDLVARHMPDLLPLLPYPQ